MAEPDPPRGRLLAFATDYSLRGPTCSASFLRQTIFIEARAGSWPTRRQRSLPLMRQPRNGGETMSAGLTCWATSSREPLIYDQRFNQKFLAIMVCFLASAIYRLTNMTAITRPGFFM